MKRLVIPRPNRRKPRYWRTYKKHQYSAKKRGVLFEISFEDWLQIWIDSGHLHERGQGADQYCMARFGDKGPYAVGNVKIILTGDNTREACAGKPKTDECKRKISQTKSGILQTIEHRNKISEGLRRAYAEGRR